MKKLLSDTKFIELINKVNNKIELDKSNGKVIYPHQDDVLRCLELPIEKIKVVIIGQDPYHGKDQANGLAFSVNRGIKLPPSLKNIYKEIQNEMNIEMNFNNGDLTSWEKQGVLLLNTSLTVIEKLPGSHSKIGWNELTDYIIKHIQQNSDKVIFVLWGNHAISKKTLIDQSKHYILTSTHPSPFSARNGFFGSNVFIKINEILIKDKKETIDWQIV